MDGGEGGGVKKKKLIESKLDKRLQVGVAYYNYVGVVRCYGVICSRNI